MLHTPSRSLATLVLSSLLSLPALGQTPLWFPPSDVDETDLDPGAVGVVGRTAFGDFDHDVRPDVALVSDDDIVLVDGFNVFRSVNTLWSSSAVNDIGTVRFAAGDGLVVVDELGLSELEIDDGSVVQRVVDHTALWADAQRVISADVDADTKQEYVALDATCENVLVYLGPSQPTFVIPLGAPADPDALAALNWTSPASGPDHLELAVGIPSQGLYVFDSTGATLLFLSGAASEFALETVRQDDGPSDTTDRLAVLTSQPGIDWLSVLDATSSDPAIWLGDAGAFALRSGDLDFDGDQELVVGFEDTQELVALANVSDTSGVSFDFATSEVIEYGTANAPLGMRSWPEIGDGDNDGDLDVIAFAPADGAKPDRVYVALNDTYPAVKPVIEEKPDPDYAGDYQYELPAPEPSGWGSLRFEFAEPLTSTFDDPMLQVTIWRQTVTPSFDTPVHGDWGTTDFFSLEDANSGNWDFEFENGGNADTEWMYYLELRIVDRPAAGEVLDAGPSGLYWFSTNPDDKDAKLTEQGQQEPENMNLLDSLEQVVHLYLPGGREIVPGVGGQEEIPPPPINY